MSLFPSKTGLLFIAFLITHSLAFSQEESTVFQKEGLVKLTIETDIKALIKNKFKDEYQPAKIIANNDGVIREKEIRLKARGAFRKKHCKFPPIKLNFKHTEFEDPGLQQLKTLKLVTHCQNQDAYQNYILKEYLVYKIFNLFTEQSFRVRLIEVTYKDTSGKHKPTTKLSFIIEHADAMAQRNGTTIFERENIATAQTSRKEMTFMSVFHYMVGNTDWYVPELHNIKLLTPTKPGAIYPVAVPYDFDYSGIVNASYAEPDPVLGISSVRERVFRGICRENAEFMEALKMLEDKKEEIYALIHEFEYLNEGDKTEMVNYLDEFFIEVANNPNRLIENFDNSCIGTK
ncbi:hypothetical protein [Flexithrix dorotheae]|uniref:hypothetical protein n=1 Tax=Flexithrix dorotheae TaxID=70993 RepID=UPI0003698C3A|nr:hypothetical protein [Flexithrix dorotheae]